MIQESAEATNPSNKRTAGSVFSQKTVRLTIPQWDKELLSELDGIESDKLLRKELLELLRLGVRTRKILDRRIAVELGGMQPLVMPATSPDPATISAAEVASPLENSSAPTKNAGNSVPPKGTRPILDIGGFEGF